MINPPGQISIEALSVILTSVASVIFFLLSIILFFVKKTYNSGVKEVKEVKTEVKKIKGDLSETKEEVNKNINKIKDRVLVLEVQHEKN